MKSNIAAAAYRLETHQKKQNIEKLEDFEDFVNEKGWHHNVCQTDVKVTEIHLVMYLEMIPSPQLASCSQHATVNLQYLFH